MVFKMSDQVQQAEEQITKKQSALEVVTREVFNRNMYLFIACVSFVGIILSTLNKTAWANAMLLGAVFMGVYLFVKTDKEIERLKVKYDAANSWGIWTIQKILKRN